MTFLAINWSIVGIKAAQFVLSFSILVILHEFGHFLPAKWFKCRVEKFYLFFNPWFSLAKKKIGETEWGLGWIPFGGYVKISGMIDESMDKEQMKLPPKEYEFRAKKAWQRLIIMLGGVTVNVLLAIIIFIGITWVWGDEHIKPLEAKYGLAVDSLGKTVGLKDGDIILKIDTNTVKDEANITKHIILSEAKNITVLRNGKDTVIQLPESLIRQLNKQKGLGFVELRFPCIIDTVDKKFPAYAAGLKKGDKIIAVNNINTEYYHLVTQEIKKYKNETVQTKIVRNNIDTLTIPIKTTEDGRIGFSPIANYTQLGFRVDTVSYSFIQSISKGTERCFITLQNYLTGIKQLFSGKANPNESLGSVISIGSVFPGVWDWQSFWTLTAIFSIILAFMNVLPIPALDGGHALFTIIEIITGKKPSDKFMEYAQTVGMILLLGLMAYALGLDVFRLFAK
ncbi:MAG: RIP metalloprotease RseP [Bacteroidetes bacterium]|nr:RIP metalloprotease RseP [Bacteroidota bacterium]MBS1671582.1 RIP metalloprotease RseP [Bacteroidota bacterium]